MYMIFLLNAFELKLINWQSLFIDHRKGIIAPLYAFIHSFVELILILWARISDHFKEFLMHTDLFFFCFFLGGVV